MSTLEIRKTDLNAFDLLYNDNSEPFDEWLDYAEKCFDKQKNLGIKTISCQDTSYPSRLKAIGNDAPCLIYLLGNSFLLTTDKAVAVIGARAADAQGLDAAFRSGETYTEKGNVIISGLALGCGKAAHEGCLSVEGKTIAIVASWLDITHPRENIGVQRRILEYGGLLIPQKTYMVEALCH